MKVRVKVSRRLKYCLWSLSRVGIESRLLVVELPKNRRRPRLRDLPLAVARSGRFVRARRKLNVRAILGR